MCTMQAPHRPVPQPNLVPVSLRSSRITHNSGVAGGAPVDAALPFTVKFVAIASSLRPRRARPLRADMERLIVEWHFQRGRDAMRRLFLRIPSIVLPRAPERRGGCRQNCIIAAWVGPDIAYQAQ